MIQFDNRLDNSCTGNPETLREEKWSQTSFMCWERSVHMFQMDDNGEFISINEEVVIFPATCHTTEKSVDNYFQSVPVFGRTQYINAGYDPPFDSLQKRKPMDNQHYHPNHWNHQQAAAAEAKKRKRDGEGDDGNGKSSGSSGSSKKSRT